MGHFRESDRETPKIMTRLHARIAERCEVTPLRIQDRFNHWEDEDLGIPPVETLAWFDVRFGPFVFATLETAYGWPEGMPERIAIRLWLNGSKSRRWFAVIDSSVRHVLEASGFNDSGQWQATWPATDSSIDGIVTQLERLGATPIRVLRDLDLPPDVPWPTVQTGAWITSADRVSFGEESDRGNGRTRDVRLEIGGRTLPLTLDDAGLAFLHWWKEQSAPRAEASDT